MKPLAIDLYCGLGGWPLVVENVKGAQRWIGGASWAYGSYLLWGDVPALMLWSGRFKGFGGSWFAENHNGASGAGGNPVDGSGLKIAAQRNLESEGVKTVGHANIRDGYDHTRHLTNQRESEGVKQRGSGVAWFDKALDERRKEASVKVTISPTRTTGNRTSARKAASAQIAKIPFELARWIAHVYKP